MRENNDQNVLLNTLDNPKRILFWTMDEVLLVFIFFMMGLIFNIFILLLIFPVKMFYGKLKRRFPRGLFKHKVYWNMPHKVFIKSGRYKNLPPSYVRDILL